MADVITLAEAMALAVLKGDLVAAHALADRLQEQRDNPSATVEKAAMVREEWAGAVTGFAVYQWPEFRALCQRLGVLFDLTTVEMVITLKVDEPVTVDQKYCGTDLGTRQTT